MYSISLQTRGDILHCGIKRVKSTLCMKNKILKVNFYVQNRRRRFINQLVWLKAVVKRKDIKNT